MNVLINKMLSDISNYEHNTLENNIKNRLNNNLKNYLTNINSSYNKAVDNKEITIKELKK